jgi:hypothetical protein
MSRCESRVQAWTGKGPDNREGGRIQRCTREAGHHVDVYDGKNYKPGEGFDLHRNLLPGHKVKWPDSAAMKETP